MERVWKTIVRMHHDGPILWSPFFFSNFKLFDFCYVVLWSCMLLSLEWPGGTLSQSQHHWGLRVVGCRRQGRAPWQYTRLRQTLCSAPRLGPNSCTASLSSLVISQIWIAVDLNLHIQRSRERRPFQDIWKPACRSLFWVFSTASQKQFWTCTIKKLPKQTEPSTGDAMSAKCSTLRGELLWVAWATTLTNIRISKC